MIPSCSRLFMALVFVLIGAFVAPQSLFAQCITPPSGLVAWWSLDETTGPTASDLAGSVNNSGTWMNSPVPVAGMVAGGLSFSGTSSVDVPDQAELNFGTGDFTIDLWIKTTSSSGTRTIIDKRTGTVPNISGYILFMANGNLGSQIGDGAGYNNCVTTGFIADGNWHHIALTVDRNSASGWRHYVDGNLLATICNPTAYQGSLTNTAPFVMARNLLSSGQNFSGTLDEVDLFNRALDSLEIRSIWAAGSSGKCKLACYATGDANNDGVALTVSDLTYLAAFINACGPAPDSLYTCDLNGDGSVNIADVQLYQSYFASGLAVFAPYGGYPVPCLCDPIPAPVPDSVTIFGLEHTSRGTACLEEVGDTLRATRLGSSGENGLSIGLPEGCSRWAIYYQNLDYGTSIPSGAQIVAEWRGVIEGEPDQYMGSTQLQKLDDCNWCLSVNSASSTYTLRVYNRGELVYEQKQFSFDKDCYITNEFVNCVDLSDEQDLETWIETFHNEETGESFSWTDYNLTSCTCEKCEGRQVSIAGGPSHLPYDRISIIPYDSIPGLTALSSATIYAKDVPSLTVISETHAVDYREITCTNLGEATLAIADSTLVVGNIGSSGLDGMSAEHDEKDGDWAIVCSNPDPSGALPIGAKFETRFANHRIGFPPPEPIDPFSMAISMAKAATNTWNLAVQSGASSYTVKAFNNGSQVFSGTDNGASGLGSIVETAKGVYPAGFKGASTGKPASVVATADYVFTSSPSGVRWTWAAHGIANLTIDSLSISGEIFAVSPVGITHSSMCGANGDKGDPISFTVLDIVFTPSYICGDADANAIVNISDAVHLIAYIFAGGPAPNPLASGDANCDSLVNISDAVYLIAYIFAGGPAPCAACK